MVAAGYQWMFPSLIGRWVQVMAHQFCYVTCLKKSGAYEIPSF